VTAAVSADATACAEASAAGYTHPLDTARTGRPPAPSPARDTDGAGRSFCGARDTDGAGRSFDPLRMRGTVRPGPSTGSPEARDVSGAGRTAFPSPSPSPSSAQGMPGSDMPRVLPHPQGDPGSSEAFRPAAPPHPGSDRVAGPTGPVERTALRPGAPAPLDLGSAAAGGPARPVEPMARRTTAPASPHPGSAPAAGSAERVEPASPRPGVPVPPHLGSDAVAGTAGSVGAAVQRVGAPEPLPVRGARAERPNPAEAVPGIRRGDRSVVDGNAGIAPTPRVGTVRGTMGKPQLPRRRAQEHIVPQLRGGPTPRQDTEQPVGHDPGLMAAFQRGVGLAEAQQSLEADGLDQAPSQPSAAPLDARLGPAGHPASDQDQGPDGHGAVGGDISGEGPEGVRPLPPRPLSTDVRPSHPSRIPQARPAHTATPPEAYGARAALDPPGPDRSTARHDGSAPAG
ncbi:hypothetical protein ABZ421_30350, partial [Streptomyces sp. NPDC005859]